jgi:hypothetical protein
MINTPNDFPHEWFPHENGAPQESKTTSDLIHAPSPFHDDRFIVLILTALLLFPEPLQEHPAENRDVQKLLNQLHQNAADLLMFHR